MRTNIGIANKHTVRDSRCYSLSVDGRDFKLSENFALHEFASRGGDLVIVHPALVHGLERLRRSLGGLSIRINSAFRTDEHNRSVGGKPQSRHLWGMAADITVDGLPPRVVAEAARALEFGGVGEYATFTHVDVEGYERRWASLGTVRA